MLNTFFCPVLPAVFGAALAWLAFALSARFYR